VPSTAEPADIKAAYRRRALALHPDVNPAEDAAQRFAEVSGAYGAPLWVATICGDVRRDAFASPKRARKVGNALAAGSLCSPKRSGTSFRVLEREIVAGDVHEPPRCLLRTP